MTSGPTGHQPSPLLMAMVAIVAMVLGWLRPGDFCVAPA